MGPGWLPGENAGSAKHENLGLDPCGPCKKLGVVMHTCNPVLRLG